MASFTDACIEHVIARLELYFPTDAALLREGERCATQAHSPNGWMTRPMGRMLQLCENSVARMRNPHPCDSVERNNIHAWFEIVLVADLENKELGAWGRDCRPTREVIASTEAWLRSPETRIRKQVSFGLRRYRG